MPLHPSLQVTLHALIAEFHLIHEARKEILLQLAEFIRYKVDNSKPVSLNFICTHNSRRSHLAQIWAQAAASYYSIPGVECYSGGMASTAFNPRAVRAMSKAGFEIVMIKEGSNPTYSVSYSAGADPIIAFSKKYDDPFNHNQDFAAIMTCSHADDACPFVPGASKRIAITYEDPKEFDDTPLESDQYDQRVRQIGREILYAFSKVKQ